eukprot:scaffold116353_cov66-Phaeocystis_antarctica.AAC.5
MTDISIGCAQAAHRWLGQLGARGGQVGWRAHQVVDLSLLNLLLGCRPCVLVRRHAVHQQRSDVHGADVLRAHLHQRESCQVQDCTGERGAERAGGSVVTPVLLYAVSQPHRQHPPRPGVHPS